MITVYPCSQKKMGGFSFLWLVFFLSQIELVLYIEKWAVKIPLRNLVKKLYNFYEKLRRIHFQEKT